MYNIHESWKPLFDKYDFNLDNLYNSGDIVYPPREQIFKVFEMNVHDIKVVLLGQDPYYRPNQAHGLSFSISNDIKIPQSLKNIFKVFLVKFFSKT
jgi:uracil-DNA glycosylase